MRLMVGTYTGRGGAGIVEIELSGDRLSIVRAEGSVKDPRYLAVNRAATRLYAAGEGAPCVAAAYDISGGGLRLLGARETGGAYTCHLCLSPDERFVYAANYGDGSVSVFPVSEDGLGERIQLIQNHGRGEDPARQEGPHAHCVAFAPDGAYLALCDLGLDAIITYRWNASGGTLSEASRLSFTGGLGVRHIAFADENTAFAVHEMGNAVSRLEYAGGVFRLAETYPVLDEDWRGKSTCAAVRVFGDRVYASNRGHDSLSALTTSGELLGSWKTGGRCPRDFVILGPDRALVAHQDSGDVGLYAIEKAGLRPLDRVEVPAAVCVLPISG